MNKTIAPNYKELLQSKNEASHRVITIKDENAVKLLKEELKAHLSKEFEREIDSSDRLQMKERAKVSLVDYLNDKRVDFSPVSLKSEIIDEIVLAVAGYGVLEPLMQDDDIEEIYIYGPDKIWYLKNGQKEVSDISFKSEDDLRNLADNLLGLINRSVNSSNPIEDGRLPDGSRLAVSAGVLSPNGFTMNIRKFKKDRLTLDKMVANGTFTNEVKELLVACITAKLNFVVSGGTASGKTTLLNAMSQYIPANENVESIEDNIELQLNREFWLQLETRKANLEGNGQVSMADLLVHLLRRSPDRIIVGEIREGKVADTFLNAIQTGHDGTCATVHANNAERCRERVSKLAASGANQPFKSAKDDFENSIHLIIQIKKCPIVGRRIITEICEMCSDKTLHHLVRYDYEIKDYVYNSPRSEVLRIFNEYNIKWGV